MMTRRHFVEALGVLTAAAGLGLGGAIAVRRRLAADGIRPDSVLPLQGRAVVLRGRGGRVLRGELDVDAVRRPARRGAPATEQISLRVSGDLAAAPGGSYRLETDDLILGDLEFLPVGGIGRDRRLEAVIARLV